MPVDGGGSAEAAQEQESSDDAEYESAEGSADEVEEIQVRTPP